MKKRAAGRLKASMALVMSYGDRKKRE